VRRSIVPECSPAAGRPVGERLRPSHPRPQRHRLVPRPRPTQRRRTRPRPDHTPRRTDEPKSSPHSSVTHRETQAQRGTPAATRHTSAA
jgi:hypothetical protein